MANNVKFKAPALPIPPAQYNQSLYQRTFSVLRLYFNQIDEHLRQDLGDTTINGDLTVTGGVTATTLTGTLQTAAQTNITSVGALDGGSITSNFGSINVGSSSISNTGIFIIGSTSQYAPFGVINGGLTLNLGTSKTFDIVSTNTSASDHPIIQSYRDSSSPADADALGTIRYQGNNDADQKVTYAEVEAQADDVTDGTEDGAYKISRMVAGTSTVGFELNASGVDISTPLTVNTGPITINSNDTNADLVISNSEASSAEASPIIKLSRSHGSSGGNDGDEIGEIQFFGANDRGLSSGGPQQILYASLFTEIIDSSDGSEDGGLKYSRVTGGAQQTGDLVTQPLNGGVQFPAQSAAPSSPANGQVYYDTDDHKLKLYANGAWVDLN